MLITSPQVDAVPCPADHIGFVAGRYRDGAVSDQWTDVRRCAHATFTAVVAACTCGWRGPWLPNDPAGLITARRQCLALHLHGTPRSHHQLWCD